MSENNQPKHGYQPQVMEKVGSNTGMQIKRLKRVRTLLNRNFMHWICSLIHPVQVCT